MIANQPAKNRFHTQTVVETARQLDAQLQNGLSAEDVRSRLAQHGPNELASQPRTPLWRLFVNQFLDFIVLLLIAAALISFALNDAIEGAAILAIVVVNAVIGLVQEQRADAAIEQLKRLAAPTAQVLRDGAHVTVASRDLVPGDIVYLEAGNFVPADGQLVESFNLQIDESSLTGESAPGQKQSETVSAADAPIGDRTNMVFSGTTVSRGRATAVIVATGALTEMGTIAGLMSGIVHEHTPLQRRLNQLGRTLGIAALILCALVFALEAARNTDLGLITRSGIAAYFASEGASLTNAFMLATSLAVAAVPEGLSAIVTINLAIGMREMIKRHALVRRLTAVETLGSATIICSDKTGTLTQNVMTVVRGYCSGEFFRVTGEGGEPRGEFINDRSNAAVDPNAPDHAALHALLRGGLLCSDALLEKWEGQHRTVGDPTEGALVVAAAKSGLMREAAEEAYPRMDEIPFDSERKMMSTLHRASSESVLVLVKGAPDVVLGRCMRERGASGADAVLDATARARILAANHDFGAQSLRVLAVAERTVPALTSQDPDVVESDLTFVGLLGMMDPPRPEVASAIRTAATAGIRTVMITGDYPATAHAIAKQIGLVVDGTDELVVSGAEISAMNDEALSERVKLASVFARVSPEDKLRLVGAFKHNGHVVAMTGDGVNDAPALKRADIGVAMGITGTDVSKEVADMVLTDDNFASIVSAVEQGRVIYANIRKFVVYLLGCNIAEIIVILGASVAGLASPLNAIQLLWLNLITDGAPALALGLERAEPDVMNQPPRPPKEPLIGRSMIARLTTQSLSLAAVVLAVYVLALQFAPGEAHTMAFVTLALAELPLAYASRSERLPVTALGVFSNRTLQLAVAVSLLGILAVVYVPALQPIFDTTPLSLAHLAALLPAIFAPALAVETAKHITGRNPIPA